MSSSMGRRLPRPNRFRYRRERPPRRSRRILEKLGSMGLQSVIDDLIDSSDLARHDPRKLPGAVHEDSSAALTRFISSAEKARTSKAR